MVVERAMHRLVTALLVAAGFTVSGFGGGQTASRAAGAAPVPYIGTAEVRYQRLPWYLLPSSAVSYAGDIHVRVDFAVRDQQHFRLELQTLSPAIDSGRRTVVEDGRTVVVYDERTGTALRGTLPRATLSPIPEFPRAALLQQLLTGNSLGPGGPLPAGVTSAGAAVRQIRHLLRLRYPPEYPPSFARIVGHQLVDGYFTAKVHYGPLQISDTITGCSFQHPGHCVHHYRRIGSEVEWIDPVHRFVLRSRAYLPPPDPHSVTALDSGSFNVTNIEYGNGPTDGDLRFTFPVPVRNVGNADMLFGQDTSEGGGSGEPNLPAGFLTFPPPPQLPHSEGFSTYGQGAAQSMTGVDFLFSTGRKVKTYLHPGDRYGFGLYIAGPYLYVQERRQVHGLPAALRAGTPGKAGACSVWTGTYAGNQNWLAFQNGRVSIRLVSNSLSRDALIAYVAGSVCRTVRAG